MTTAILCEKGDAAARFAKALGGTSGTYQGQPYRIVHASGHLYELAQPPEQVPENLRDAYKSWKLENLPWDLSLFSWKRVVPEGSGKFAGQKRAAVDKLAKELKRPEIDEIAMACDLDPTGEGGLIAGEVIQELGLEHKKLSRMYFTDDAAKSVQKAFLERKSIPSLRTFDEFLMANTRSKFDFASIQLTRAATSCAGLPTGQMLRQGRLKSPIVIIVGDQWKAIEAYVKKPFYSNRFRDENGVVYTDKDAPVFEKKEEVPTDLTDSPVVHDSTENKRTSPPRLIDLARLTGLMDRHGLPTKTVLATYQKMYQDHVVSYPRTEDKHVTTEQFNEMLPLIDKIAGLVGVDTALLTHRQPRKTHVKDSGAHGANRPGLNVPDSLDDLDARYGKGAELIYTTLAKSYLSIHAEDYVYEHQVGHVEKYPSYVGVANIPKELGFKAVFDPDEGESDEQDSVSGLGRHASPFVHEGFPPKPATPTFDWLVKQLDKRDVGTGATRSATIGEMIETARCPLLERDKKRALRLSQHGKMSYHLLQGTHIGDLDLTERLFKQLKQVSKGELDEGAILDPVADMVRDDVKTMTANVKTLPEDIRPAPAKKRACGVWNGREVTFVAELSGVEFSEEQIKALLAGETIEFTATSKEGHPYTARGKLADKEFKGKKYVGFELEARPEGVPASWAKHTFTEAERADLEAGKRIYREDWIGAQSGEHFSAEIRYDVEPGQKRKKIIPEFMNKNVPAKFSGHTFTAAEKASLEAGESLYLDDLYSNAKKKTYASTIKFDKNEKKIVFVDAKGSGPKRSTVSSSKSRSRSTTRRKS